MARLKLSNIKEFKGKEKVLYETFPSNLINAMLTYAPTQVESYEGLGSSFRKGVLNSKEREFIICRVAYLSNSDYEIMQHYEIAKSGGVTKEELHAVKTGKTDLLTDKSAVLLKFVDETILNVQCSKQTFSDMQHYFNDKEIGESLLLIGHYMMTARFLRGLDVDLDESPTSWDRM
ncbi:carboxymuconolactone decarboxylase family protein [Staphylococcus roterodami]|nr:carboxymuconolactone decarboxylase family protein [Staphylococcus roterodami]